LFPRRETGLYAITLRGGSLFRVSVTMAPFLLPMMFQLGFGLNPFASGLLILPLFAGSVGTKIVTTRLLRRYGFRRVLLMELRPRSRFRTSAALDGT
jgi:hypothetical protein